MHIRDINEIQCISHLSPLLFAFALMIEGVDLQAHLDSDVLGKVAASITVGLRFALIAFVLPGIDLTLLTRNTNNILFH